MPTWLLLIIGLGLVVGSLAAIAGIDTRSPRTPWLRLSVWLACVLGTVVVIGAM